MKLGDATPPEDRRPVLVVSIAAFRQANADRPVMAWSSQEAFEAELRPDAFPNRVWERAALERPPSTFHLPPSSILHPPSSILNFVTCPSVVVRPLSTAWSLAVRSVQCAKSGL